MRTIKKNLLSRILVQAEEAEIQGLTKVAEHLTNQADKNSSNVRNAESFYVYSHDDFKKDIEGQFWNAVIRIADYHDVGLDATELQATIEAAASDFVQDIRGRLGIKTAVGAFEPDVPGELEKVTLEVGEDDDVRSQD